MSADLKPHSEDNILIVKGRFKSNANNLYGQILIIFTRDGGFENYNVVCSTYSDLYNIEPHDEWFKYEEVIADLKWKGNFNANITHSIIDQLKNLSEDFKEMQLFFECVYNYDYNNLDITLFDLINRVVHDKNLILETGIQEVTPEEYYKIKNDRDKVEEKGTTKTPGDSRVEEGAAILPVKPIVSPVRGKPIYELRIGDKIIIKIQANSDRANYFIDLLDLREENNVRPVPAEVIDIKAGTDKKDPIEILTNIGPGIYGKFTEEEKQVKLKIYDPSIDGQISKKSINSAANKMNTNVNGDIEESVGFSKGTMFMLILFILILSLFIVLIFISWG